MTSPSLRLPTAHLVATLVLLALTSWLASCTSETVTPPPAPTPPTELPDLGGREARVAVLADHLPYSRIDPETGAVQGFDYDLLTAMAARLNLVTRFVAAEPSTLLAELAAGHYELAGSGIAYTLQRAPLLDFAAPYKLEELHLAVRAAEQRVATIAEFHDSAELRAGAMPGTTSYDMAIAFLGESRVTGFANYVMALDALAAGTVDGVVLEDTELHQEQDRQPGVLTSLPGPLGGNISAYALPKGSDLTAPLNSAFEQLLAEGAVTALREKWGL